MAEIHDNEISTPSGATAPDLSVSAYPAGTSPTGTTGGTGTKADEAKQKAAAVADQATTDATNVKEHAAQAVGDVKQQAGAEIASIKSEATDQVRSLAHEAKDKVGAQADTAASQLATLLTDAGQQLSSMASQAEKQGPLTDVVRQLGQRVESSATRLDNGGYQSVVNDVTRFARNKPGMFLAAAVGAGFVVGRLLRNTDTQSIAQAAKGESPDAYDASLSYSQDAYSTGTYAGGPATPTTADAYATTMAVETSIPEDELGYGAGTYAPSHHGGGIR